MAGRLRGKGVSSVADLKALWQETGCRDGRMRGWLQKNIPGASKFAINGLVKSLKAQHDWR